MHEGKTGSSKKNSCSQCPSANIATLCMSGTYILHEGAETAPIVQVQDIVEEVPFESLVQPREALLKSFVHVLNLKVI
jgi:hypothetical protein